MKLKISINILVACMVLATTSTYAQNVGLGILSPQAKLHVKGSDNIPQLIIEANSAQTNAFPLIKLRSSFGSDLLWIHSDTAFNIFIGHDAGRINNAVGGGIYNTFIGKNAGNSNTTGSLNTVNGGNAFSSNTTGSSNSAFGGNALFSNTTGSSNSAHGFYALYSNTTGFLNTAAGYEALYSNTTGKFNSANGARSLYSNTTGLYNSAYGIDALYSNISGAGNTAIGNAALYSNTSGYLNSAQGYLALTSNTTGYENTAHGPYSIYSNTTGSQNTALGYGAMFANTTGTYNTVVGYNANVSSDALNNATAIGANALVATSNSIVLGSIQGVNGATVSTNVGIGASAPSASAKLDISSTTQGLLIPRVTTAQRNAIATPATGLMVFDLDKRTVYLYDGTKWYPMLFTTAHTKIPLSPVIASDGTTGDAFGNAVSIGGDYVVIGASNNDIGSNNNQGSAYIFHREGGAWKQQAMLTASNGAALDVFGTDVSINEAGDQVVVGARQGPGPNHANQGAAYVFSRTGSSWTQIAILTASDGLSGDWFGQSVSIYGDYIAVGAQNHNVDIFSDAGSVYVFYKGSGWTTNQPYQDKLTASDLMSTDNFGSDVSLHMDYLAVGASGDEDPGVPDRGAAYIFGRTGTDWIQLAKLTASDGTQYDYYGGSISLYGDYVIVGTFINDIPGAAYVYFKDAAWVTGQAHQARLTGPDAVSSEFFGNSVSLYGDYALLGCSYKDVGSNNEQGAAYLFKRSGTTWNFVRRLDDETGHPNEFFGGSVSIHGFNLAIGGTGKNGKGEVQFLNIE